MLDDHSERNIPFQSGDRHDRHRRVQGIESETGIRPSWSSEAFPEPAADVRQGIKRIQANPFIPKTDRVRGFVFDVATGAINEVDPA